MTTSLHRSTFSINHSSPSKKRLLTLGMLLATSPLALADQRIEVTPDQTLMVVDHEGWNGSWNFMCVNNHCSPGVLEGNRWVRDVTNLNLSVGNQVTLQFKVQDNAKGQYISDAVAVEVTTAGTSPTPPPVQPPSVNPTPTPQPTPQPAPAPTPEPPVAELPPEETPTPTPQPQPSPQPAPSPQPTPAPQPLPIDDGGTDEEPTDPPTTQTGNQGVTDLGNGRAEIWIKDNNYTGNFRFACINGSCANAELVEGRWVRTVEGLANGTAYNVEFKIQDNTQGQVLESWSFTWSGEGAKPNDGNNNSGNPDNNGGGASNRNNNGSAGLGTVGGKDNQVVAPSVAEKMPAIDLGFDGKNHYLVAGMGQGSDKYGYSLYTFSADTAGASNCEDCAEWPPALLTDENQLIQPSRLQGELSHITLSDGRQQLTYQGMPLYFRAADTEAGQTDGANDNWPLAQVELSPLADNLYQHALQTPSNMPLAQNGFQFDINGSQVTWAFGPVLASTSKSNVTFVCTPDQMAFYEVDISGGSATVPSECGSQDRYWYFFQYELANAGGGKYVMDNTYEFDEATAYRYTALFVNDGSRLDLGSRGEFKDVGANWMRFRHPRAYDGVTEAIRDATHNSSRVAELARYSLHATESNNGGAVSLEIDLNMPMSYTGQEQGLVRLEGIQNGAGDAKLPTWRYNFAASNNQTTYTIDGLSYGQNISFEMTGVVGRISSQTYNTFQYYTVGMGFHSPIGDPRLSLVGKGGTHMVFNKKNVGGEFKNGHIGAGIHDAIMEKAALFTQHLTTITSPSEVDDFLWGHHLFHGVKLQRSTVEQPSQENLGSNPGDTGIGREMPEIKAGAPVACGDCHYRDGRGSDVIDTPKGKFIAPATFGVGLLQYIEGREAGFGWKGKVATVREQIKQALINDHQIDPNNPDDISPEHLDLISKYTEYLTVPARFPGVYDDPDVVAGDRLFHETGCADCHTPIQHTSAQAPEAFRNLSIRPYTDMKVHAVAGGNYRTAALWGLGRNIDLLENNNKLVNGEIDIGIALYDGDDQEQMKKHHMRQRDVVFLHDGRAKTLKEAIEMHGTDGEAAKQVTAFGNLSGQEQAQIVKFLKSL